MIDYFFILLGLFSKRSALWSKQKQNGWKMKIKVDIFSLTNFAYIYL